MSEKEIDIWKERNKGVDLAALQGKEDLTEYKLNMILRHFNMSMFDYDIQKDMVYVQKEDMLLYGFTDYWFRDEGEYYRLEHLTERVGELIRKSMVEFTVGKLEEIRRNISGEMISFDTPVIYKPGNTRWINIIANTLLDGSGKPAWVMGCCRDVQAEVKEHARLEKIARTDRLTGFRNRSSGMEKIGEQLTESGEAPHYIAVVDLDKFKTANDLFGHTFGDLILKEASECMNNTLERGTVFCRTGGDEFLLFGKCKDSDHAMQLMTHLKKEIAHRVTYRGVQFDVSASIGVSVYPIHGANLEELYNKADMAMYHAKKNGLNEPALYNDTMNAIDLGKSFPELLSQNKALQEGYTAFLQHMKESLGEDTQEFMDFEKSYREDFQRGVENDSSDRRVLIEGERLIIRAAHIGDAEFMSRVEQDKDNSPWVANWPLGWRVAKLGDEDFLQVILEQKDGMPIGFIIFCDMLQKENRIQLKRIAILNKGKGYGKEALYLAQKMAFEIFHTKRLYLSTKKENTRAQSIYKATGFLADKPDPCTKFHMDREDYAALIGKTEALEGKCLINCIEK